MVHLQGSRYFLRAAGYHVWIHDVGCGLLGSAQGVKLLVVGCWLPDLGVMFLASSIWSRLRWSRSWLRAAEGCAILGIEAGGSALLCPTQGVKLLAAGCELLFLGVLIPAAGCWVQLQGSRCWRHPPLSPPVQVTSPQKFHWFYLPGYGVRLPAWSGLPCSFCLFLRSSRAKTKKQKKAGCCRLPFPVRCCWLLAFGCSFMVQAACFVLLAAVVGSCCWMRASGSVSGVKLLPVGCWLPFLSSCCWLQAKGCGAGVQAVCCVLLAAVLGFMLLAVCF